jgi:hypothetical protein
VSATDNGSVSREVLREQFLKRHSVVPDPHDDDAPVARCSICSAYARWSEDDTNPICLGEPACSARTMIEELLKEITGPTRVVFSQMDAYREDDDPVTLGEIPDYPVEALPPAAQGLVKDAERAGLPAALVGGAALGAMAAALGSGSRMRVLSNERAILWVPLVGPAGVGKSPAMALAFGRLRELDAEAEDDHRILLGDLTLEALGRELSCIGGAGALDLDELAILLRGLGEYKRGGGGDRARFLKLWTGDPWSVTRVAGGSKTNKLRIRVDRPTIAIVGGLQPHLHELLGADEDGSRARWLPHLAAMPEHIANVPTSIRPKAWDDLIDKLIDFRSVERDWYLAEDAEPVFLRHRSAWKRQASGVETATMATALGKADVHLARIALVLAEADQPGSSGFVSAEHVESASWIVDFALNCWRALPANGGMSLTRKDETLDHGVSKLLGWLESHGGRASRRDLQMAHVGGARTSDDLDALIQRYEAIFPGTVTEERSKHGGPMTIIVSAPRRSTVASGNSGITDDQKSCDYRRSGPVATGNSVDGNSGLATDDSEEKDR